MARCEVCGNEYGPSFEIQLHDAGGVFENFEWIIQSPSPNCAHCGCQVMGHGTESTDFFSAILVAPLVIGSLAGEMAPAILPPYPPAEQSLSPL